MSKFPMTFDVEYPERLSRKKLLLKVFLGWLYAGIPHLIVLSLYSVAVSIITFFAFWIILFTGKYPKGMFDFVVGFYRWQSRLNAYLTLLRDEYPPFSGR